MKKRGKRKKDKERKKESELNAPIIVDETNKGFDRKTLLDKLKQSKLIKVSMKPVIEMNEKINEKIESVSKKPEENIKKAKK